MFKYFLIAMIFIGYNANAQTKPAEIIDLDKNVYYVFEKKSNGHPAAALAIDKEYDYATFIVDDDEVGDRIFQSDDNPWYGENPLLHAYKRYKIEGEYKMVVYIISLSNGSMCEHNTRFFIVIDKKLDDYGYQNQMWDDIDLCSYDNVYVDVYNDKGKKKIVFSFHQNKYRTVSYTYMLN